jgi:formylglycine-generating enzyme required for sulfatase activity
MRSTNREKPKYWDQVDTRKHADLPVVGVSWYDADAYCRWTRKRLPTEAEWEKAARGTDGFIYPWGNEEPTSRLANFGKMFAENAYSERLVGVDSYEAGKSPFGLHHMAGNVWEWVTDWYYDGYYAQNANRNPAGPIEGEYRVLRGGSWGDGPHFLRSADRFWNTPTYRSARLGFRCARDVPH